MDYSAIEQENSLTGSTLGHPSKVPTTAVEAIKEYDEYIALKQTFTGVKLQHLIRKVDIHVLPQLMIIYLLSYIDRSNVGNAKLFGALNDLGMTGQDWNTALSVFFVTYALGGTPSNIALKRFGSRKWLPLLLTTVATILICTGLQNNFGGWTAFRLLLGFVEAGMITGCSYVLSEYYSPDELHSRISIFYSGASAAGAFSGLLAYGIGQLDHVWGYRGWRWIYVIEGLFTFFVGLSSFLFVPESPEKARRWLSAKEKRFLVLRHKFVAGGESNVAEKEEFSMRYAKQAFRSPHVYAVAIMEFTAGVTVYGFSFVLPTVVKSLGYTNATAQAMTVPPYVFACFMTLYTGYAADRYKKRMLSVVLPCCMATCGFIVTMVSIRYKHLTGVTLFGIFLMTGGLYPVSPAVITWVALNISGDMERAVGIALMLSFSQLGGIMGSNIFLANESPTYPTGFGICIAMLVIFGILWPLIYTVWLKKANRIRASMPFEDIYAKYTEE